MAARAGLLSHYFPHLFHTLDLSADTVGTKRTIDKTVNGGLSWGECLTHTRVGTGRFHNLHLLLLLDQTQVVGRKLNVFIARILGCGEILGDELRCFELGPDGGGHFSFADEPHGFYQARGRHGGSDDLSDYAGEVRHQ